MPQVTKVSGKKVGIFRLKKQREKALGRQVVKKSEMTRIPVNWDGLPAGDGTTFGN